MQKLWILTHTGNAKFISPYLQPSAAYTWHCFEHVMYIVPVHTPYCMCVAVIYLLKYLLNKMCTLEMHMYVYFCYSRLMALKRMGIVDNYEVLDFYATLRSYYEGWHLFHKDACLCVLLATNLSILQLFTASNIRLSDP